MQLAGEACSVCSQKVLFDADATWCARCSTPFHRECIARAENVCPQCRKIYDAPEGHFTYSRFCPECMKPNQPARADCAACGARTRWDTAADYEKFVAHMRDTSHRYWVRGWADLGLAVVCLGTFILIVVLSSHGPVFVLPGIFLLGMFILIGDGAARLRDSRALRNF